MAICHKLTNLVFQFTPLLIHQSSMNKDLQTFRPKRLSEARIKRLYGNSSHIFSFCYQVLVSSLLNLFKTQGSLYSKVFLVLVSSLHANIRVLHETGKNIPNQK